MDYGLLCIFTTTLISQNSQYLDFSDSLFKVLETFFLLAEEVFWGARKLFLHIVVDA